MNLNQNNNKEDKNQSNSTIMDEDSPVRTSPVKKSIQRHSLGTPRISIGTPRSKITPSRVTKSPKSPYTRRSIAQSSRPIAKSQRSRRPTSPFNDLRRLARAISLEKQTVEPSEVENNDDNNLLRFVDRSESNTPDGKSDAGKSDNDRNESNVSREIEMFHTSSSELSSTSFADPFIERELNRITQGIENSKNLFGDGIEKSRFSGSTLSITRDSSMFRAGIARNVSPTPERNQSLADSFKAAEGSQYFEIKDSSQVLKEGFNPYTDSPSRTEFTFRSRDRSFGDLNVNGFPQDDASDNDSGYDTDKEVEKELKDVGRVLDEISGLYQSNDGLLIEDQQNSGTQYFSGNDLTKEKSEITQVSSAEVMEKSGFSIVDNSEQVHTTREEEAASFGDDIGDSTADRDNLGDQSEKDDANLLDILNRTIEREEVDEEEEENTNKTQDRSVKVLDEEMFRNQLSSFSNPDLSNLLIHDEDEDDDEEELSERGIKNPNDSFDYETFDVSIQPELLDTHTILSSLPLPPSPVSPLKEKLRNDSSKLPRRFVKSVAEHFLSSKTSKSRLSNRVVDVLEEISDSFLENLVDDLVDFSSHAKRKTIKVDDMILLSKRTHRKDHLQVLDRIFSSANELFPSEIVAEIEKDIYPRTKSGAK